MTTIARTTDNVTTFRGWLKGQVHRNDPIGDVARDVIRDKGTRATTHRAMRERITEIGGPLAVEAIDAANREYVNLTMPAPGTPTWPHGQNEPYEADVNYLLDPAAGDLLDLFDRALNSLLDRAVNGLLDLAAGDPLDHFDRAVNGLFDRAVNSLYALAASEAAATWHPLTDRFLDFNRQNPAVYAEIVRSCHEYRKATGNTKWGVNDCLGRVRWVLQVENTDDSGYKVNTTHAPFYARLVMHNEPALEGFFELRDAEADLDGAWIAQANHDLGVTR